MADPLQLAARDANHIARILTDLADLVDPEINQHHPLSEQQLSLMTGGSAVARRPKEWATVLRNHAAVIHKQLGEDGAEL
ncbi:hypothetical protein [Streptomyces olivoreticuli]|uniref:hypothetical protein n=1 Tax=Streptomyces olivoreticuli TaxID=68246 RepID=UPI000E249E12|nr:hypothetical protein [Streptomyces olivoreticuli]